MKEKTAAKSKPNTEPVTVIAAPASRSQPKRNAGRPARYALSGDSYKLPKMKVDTLKAGPSSVLLTKGQSEDFEKEKGKLEDAAKELNVQARYNEETADLSINEVADTDKRDDVSNREIKEQDGNQKVKVDIPYTDTFSLPKCCVLLERLTLQSIDRLGYMSIPLADPGGAICSQESSNLSVQPDDPELTEESPNLLVQPDDTESTEESPNLSVQPDDPELTEESSNLSVQPDDTESTEESSNLSVQPDDTESTEEPPNLSVQPDDTESTEESPNLSVQPDDTEFTEEPPNLSVQPDDTESTEESPNLWVQPDDTESTEESSNLSVQPDDKELTEPICSEEPGITKLTENICSGGFAHSSVKPNKLTTASCSEQSTDHDLIVKPESKDWKSNSLYGQNSGETVGKPYRPCLYCLKPQSKLVVHLKRKHRDEDRVKAAMLLPNALRNREFDKIRKEGIFAANRKILLDKDLTSDEKNSKLLKERRQGKKDISICSLCNGFYAMNTIYKHKRTCPGAEVTTAAPVGLPISTICEVADPIDFRDKILRKFRRDNVGEICRTDAFVKQLGLHNFRKVKTRTEKRDELRDAIMRDMRRFATLYLELKSLAEKDKKQITSSVDVLKREHFKYLQEAVINMTQKDDDTIKSGLKTGLGYLLKKAAKVLKGQYLLQQQDDKAEEVDKFSTLLSYFWISMFSDAEYANVKARQIDLRRPKHLPVEEDIRKLRNYVMKEIENLLDPNCLFTKTEYKSLRDMLVCRLTLFNARRGGEPSRLLLKEWEDAEKGEWISDSAKQSVNDPLEKQLIGKFRIAFQSGKNLNQMVPLLIPNDCLEGLRKLANVETRKNAGVDDGNKFLFPNTSHSEKHIKGWHAVNSVCIQAGTSKTINATSMRHRASTIYAALDVPEGERQLFYQHMGHSEEMNKNVYQCPLAVQEVTKVGRFLSNLDANGSACMATAGPSNEQLTSSNNARPSNEQLTSSNNARPSNEQLASSNNARPSNEQLNSSNNANPSKVTSSNVLLVPEEESSDYGDDSADDQNYKPTGSDIDDTAKSSEEDQEVSFKGKPVKTKRVGKKKVPRHIWTSESTHIIRAYFSSWIDDTSTFDRKGSLPGKEAISAFLKKYPEILGGFVEKKRVFLMRTKLYNERNKSRSRVKKGLKGLWK